MNRAWRIHALGGPEQLQLEPVPMPEPRSGEVVVRVLAGGLNRSDLMWLTGVLVVPNLPSTVGREICGIVEQVGPGVSDLHIGDRVSSLPFFSSTDYQTFAEYALLPACCLARTPDNLTAEQGASFVAAYLTSYCGLIETGELKPWQHVLITAATSANGMAAIAVARKAGAVVIATTRNEEKRAVLEEAGAHHVVSGQEDLPGRVAQITEGHGCELIYDGVGGRMTSELFECIAVDGHWVKYGLLDPQPVEVDWTDWFRRKTPRLTIYSLSQYAGVKALGHEGRAEGLARAVRYVFRGVAEGSLPVRIAQAFPGMEAVPDAYRALENDVGGGKIVVTF